MNRIDAIGGCRRADLGTQRGILFQEIVDLLILLLVRGVQLTRALGGCARNWRLFCTAIARRHDRRRIGALAGKAEGQDKSNKMRLRLAPIILIIVVSILT